MKKSPTSFLVVCLFVCLFFSPNFFVVAYDAKTTHPNLTEITVDFYNQHFSNQVLNETEKQLLMQGSIDEDNGIRSVNHFYDPVYNKTWQFGGAEYLFPALTAKEWAQNPFAQAIYDPIYSVFIGPIAKSPVFSKANFTWQQAIYKYVKGDRVEAFNALGHILHLIQDMSVPEHTRQNVHISFIKSIDSSYEVYSAKNNKDFYEQTRKNIENLEFVKKATLDEYFNEIALYSNNYFYSPDTILNQKYHLPEPAFYEVPEIENGKTFFYVLGEDENDNIFHLALVLKNDIGWRLTSGPTVYSLEDEQVLQDYWQRLSKKAVLNGAGVIDLFFQEVENAKSKPGFISKNEKNVLTAMVGGLSGFINDIFQKDSDFIIIDDVPDSSVTTTTKYFNSTTTIKPFDNTTTTKQTTTTIKSFTTTTRLSTTTTKPTATTTTKVTTTTLNSEICSFNTNQASLRNKVIINEVAWAGTQNSANDEWIELKNISSQEVDISNWQLIDKKEQIKIVFEKGSKISAQGFYLLERTDDFSVPFVLADGIYTGILNNADEELRLFNDNCQLQDTIVAGLDWPAGDNSSKRTMERKNDFSWQTSASINGTPKAENSSGYIESHGSSGSTSTSSSDTSSSSTTTTVATSITTITTTTLPPIVYPKILINEIKIAGLNSEEEVLAYDEFIEIFNPNEFEINLTNWYLHKKTSEGEQFSSLVPADLLENKKINALDYLLIAHASSTYTSIADILISNYSVTDNNTIILKNPNGEIVDKIGFGSANDCEGDCAINPGSGQSIQRNYADGNFLDSDNNASDFEIQNCTSPKSFSSNDCLVPTTTTTTTTPAPSSPTIPYITEFFWHPFEKDSTKIVIDFRINSYPFIPPTDNTNNTFTAMAFYFHSDLDDPSVNFGIPTKYLGLGEKNDWELHSNTSGLLLSYPNYVNDFQKIGSIIFSTDKNAAANSTPPRKLSYRIDKLPNDNHFIVDVTGTTNGQSLNFTPDQYVTIGYYGYINSYQRLIAYDNTKFYFNSSNYYHKPTNIENFEVECDNENCNNLIFSWSPASDEDPKDILKHDIHYVFAKQGDDLNNNDLIRQSWGWSQSQNVLGEPIFNAGENKFQLQVSIDDLYYLKAKRLPGVPLNVFFGIKAQDSEGLKSEIPKIFFINIPPVVPETTTTTTIITTTTTQPPDTTTTTINSTGEIICSDDAYNCSDFSTHVEAQEVFEFCGGINNDIHQFDSDEDGIACESLL